MCLKHEDYQVESRESIRVALLTHIKGIKVSAKFPILFKYIFILSLLLSFHHTI